MASDPERMFYNWKADQLRPYGDGPEDAAIKGWRSFYKREAGVQAWKVTEDGIVEWDLAVLGNFYSEDVYIVLYGILLKTTNTLSYDIHCWIGKSADTNLYKRGLYNATALFEAVLSDTAGGRALLHREVQAFESKRFTNYFEYFVVWKGTSDGSHKCDLHSEYKPRLLHFSGPPGKTISVRETALKRGSLDSNDVFIVDLGTTIYQWNGIRSNADEKKRAMEFTKKLKAERQTKGIHVVVVEEKLFPKDHAVYDAFPIVAKKRKPSKQESVVVGDKNKIMCIMTSELDYQEVAEGPNLCTRKMNSSEVVVVDIRFGKNDADDHVYIRIGNEWNGDQKSGLIYGHNYLKWERFRSDNPKPHPAVSITVVKEDQLSTQLNTAINS